MRSTYLKTLKTAVLAVTLLLLGVSASYAQVNLTAGPATASLPDGNPVPMWGYTCASATGATCTSLRPNAGAGVWSPVVITVPAGQPLTINLTNNLVFGANKIPTSLVVVGQLGAGLGNSATSTPSPDHTSAQQVTWPIAAPGVNVGTPPVQGSRVQSFSTEVPAGGGAVALTWNGLRPGTYLLESGTHPSIQGPMGLYGMVVVTTAPNGTTAGTAYPAVGTTPAVTYNAEVPLLFSEIDPTQNNAVNTAVNTAGFSETAVWSAQPGGCGIATVHTCYPPAVNYTPMYYLINGVAFDKTNPAISLFQATPGSGVTGTVLVRMVNAGLRMHVPSIVGAQTKTPTVAGFSLIAEDGNPLPGVARVQSEVFMAAGKTYDVMVNVPATGSTALPVYDRELSLSGNGTARDSGMLAYIGVNGSAEPAGAATVLTAVANADTYSSLVPCPAVPCPAFVVSDPGKGVVANDVNVFGVQVVTAPAHGTLVLNANGTFTYTPSAAGVTPDSFVYQANGNPAITATVTLGAASLEAGSGITMGNISYTAHLSTSLSIKTPGILSVDKDGKGYPLTVSGATSTVPLALNLTPATSGSGTVSVDQNGGFNATVSGPGTYTFSYSAQNSQGTKSATTGTVTLIFPQPSNLAVTVLDGVDKKTAISDYRWIIEEDRTFYVDPNNTTNTGSCVGANCTSVPPTFGVNFHTSYMPIVATGCTGTLSCESGQTLLGQPAVCDGGNGVCRTTGSQETATFPSQVALDPNRRYYISVLPGDAAFPFETGNKTPGHGMGGAPIAAHQTAVTILSEPSPYQPAKLSVFVFQDDFPLNGENDAGGGVDVLSPNEPGLGGFNITLFDDAGGTGDATGQMTYDMFNMPLSNSLSGTIDPSTGLDACPISAGARMTPGGASPTGITSTIVTCPEFESDGATHSPLRGQAVVANLMPGRYGVVATPAADRIGRGEEWLQTNTLDGQKAHDSFLRIGEPSYFQEFGPAGYHVSIGFANPAIINSRLPGVCNGTDVNIQGSNCNNTVTGKVTTERMSRTPDERLYSSGSNDSFSFTQCYVSFGDPDGEDFAFAKCAADGTFSISGLPDGSWRITVFDQWNDMLVDGLSTPVGLGSQYGPCPGGTSSGTCNMGDIAMNQWQANIYTRTFFDKNGDGISNVDAQGNPTEPGLALVATNVRFRDGSFSNFNNTDLNGFAGFNEVFPLFSWYVVETDTTRYKTTGIHVVYDAGGPADGTACGPAPLAQCGSSAIGQFMANTYEQAPVPGSLHVPGAVYCTTADCTGQSIKNGPNPTTTPNSTGRIDPPWVESEGWQGFSGQNSFLEFGKTPYAAATATAPAENGGIYGHVVYASTRPFDDPQLLLQTSWEPLVPNVTINLYQEGTAPDGSQSLTLVDTTKTSSWDDWAQGFRSDNNPWMNCPGQMTSDLFYFSLLNQQSYLDVYNHSFNGTPQHTIPFNSQYKCYDGMHNWNQLQPAPYDGRYQFPSIVDRNPVTGAPQGVGSTNGVAGSMTGTNCTVCAANPTDGTPMLPSGKYVVEVVVPPGYELVKEEDKNILIGDNFIAPVTMQFAGLGNVFILPDQAAIGSTYNANNAQNPTQDLGTSTLPRGEGDTGSIERFWPCVGASRIVPDFISLFPQSGEVSPFAGATRNLCDRKEVTLDDQAAALAKFYIFTSTHAAAHFTGVITDDFTSEFDPFSPQFGEKFSPPDMPISIKDFNGNEIARTYSDHWGSYDGLNYSTWEVNPPNPTGYAPTMMITCMNDPGPISGPGGTMITDPLYNPSYSNFCYEIPFMPGQTQYMDTPVVPTSAFAGAGYNNPDCSYPDHTPAISEVDGDGVGPWVSAAGKTLTIKALGTVQVNNYGYSGPAATTSPFNQKTVTRTYDFGSGTGTVFVGGVQATVTSWSTSQIKVTVPNGVPTCNLQQQSIYGGPSTPPQNARCGQLDIVTAGGVHSIDTVTVTIGGKTPTHVPASGSIQAAVDAARPGDLLIIDPTCTITTGAGAAAVTTIAPSCTTTGVNGTTPSAHNEMLLMWKPVRLQGVGAASSIINANAHPAGRLDPWRQRAVCLFGIAPSGAPATANTPTTTFSCGNGWSDFVGNPTNPQVDRLPLEATVGWDASLNGNLAELLQEPTLLGAYEGAGITVLAKGVNFPRGSSPFGADTFPTGTTLLTTNNCLTGPGNNRRNPFPSSFQCNPSSIDGLGIVNSSQGGGGVFVHGWAHNLQIANNRVNSNTGTLSGGISVGQGEFPPAYQQNGGTPNPDPGSCYTRALFPNNFVTTNTQLPYCFNVNVNVHNNNVTNNNTLGDELFSGTPSGAGGVAFCTGADNYKFNNNWVCGNLSTGDGGGLIQMGFSYNGDIEHNTIIFNQSTNPTISTNGGGLLIMGAPDTDPICGTAPDGDCPPGVSDGTGPGLVINANLIMGNSAESGSGGGIRFQGVNGTELSFFPDGRAVTTGRNQHPSEWYTVQVTNNIIANNVAGWDGAGVSLQDALAVNLVNNTIIGNDTTASAGVLFNTLGAPIASSQGPCLGVANPSAATPCVTTSTPQPAGVVAIQNSSVLSALLNGPPKLTLTCPAGHPNCQAVSYPELFNDVIWQNHAYYIGVGALSATYQQNIVTLNEHLFSGNTNIPVPNQSSTDAMTANGGGVIITGGTGACTPSNNNFWEVGVRGDSAPSNHASGITLAPTFSVLTDAGDYPGLNNSNSNPTVKSQYCNGSRVPPEAQGANGGGWQVPPGISDATVPNPIFNLAPSATVDEGNNWVNISWGPLALVNPVNNTTLGNYALATGSPSIDYIGSGASTYSAAPTTDFFGNPRKNNGPVNVNGTVFPANPCVDVGAVDVSAGTNCAAGSPQPGASLTPSSHSFGTVRRGTPALAAPVFIFTLTNNGTATLNNVVSPTITVNGTNFSIVPLLTTCGTVGLLHQTSLAPGASCSIAVRFDPPTADAVNSVQNGTVSITDAVGTQTASLSGTANP